MSAGADEAWKRQPGANRGDLVVRHRRAPPARRVREPEATELRATLRFDLADLEESHVIELSNGVLHHRPASSELGGNVDVTVTLPRTRLNALLGDVDPDVFLAQDDVEVVSDDQVFRRLLGLLERRPRPAQRAPPTTPVTDDRHAP